MARLPLSGGKAFKYGKNPLFWHWLIPKRQKVLPKSQKDVVKKDCF